MSTPTYKVVTKVNVTLQIEVQPANKYATLDEIGEIAAKEAIEIATRITKGHHGVSVCKDPEVFSILVKDVKQ